MNRHYIPLEPRSGYPVQHGLFYECLRCGETISSVPSDSSHCKCRNIMIDTDYGRISIQDHSQVRLYSEIP